MAILICIYVAAAIFLLIQRKDNFFYVYFVLNALKGTTRVFLIDLLYLVIHLEIQEEDCTPLTLEHLLRLTYDHRDQP